MKKLLIAGALSVFCLFSGFAADTGYVVENTDHDQLICLGEMDGFYRNRRVMDAQLESGEYLIKIPDFLCSDELDFPYVRKDNAKVRADGKEAFLSDHIMLVRLLGGWTTNRVDPTVEDAKQHDLFYLDDNGNGAYRWNLLYDRIDPFIERGYTPEYLTLVLDAIPYDLTAPYDVKIWTYGQVGIPRDFEQWGEFIRQLCLHLKDRYGEDESNLFRFRVGTEMQTDKRFAGTEEEYFKYYDYAAAAIKSVLPGAKVGGFNRTALLQDPEPEDIYLGRVAEHCAKDLNFSTGERGTPFDFLAHSFYFSKGSNVAECIRHPDDYLPVLQSLYSEVESTSKTYQDLPFEMQEFAPLVTEGGLVGIDTGVRGAAQIMETMIDFRKMGVDRIYHWYITERLWEAPAAVTTNNPVEMVEGQKLLIHGSAWLYCIFDHMRGGMSWKLPFEITGGGAANSVETFASVKDDATYVLVSCWNVDRKQIAGSTVKVTIPDSVKTFSGTPTVQQTLFDETSSVYDVIWEDFYESDRLSQVHLDHFDEYGKAVTYACVGMEYMSKGLFYPALRSLSNNWIKYQNLMTDSLTLSSFTGGATNTASGLELALTMPTPSVYVLKLTE